MGLVSTIGDLGEVILLVPTTQQNTCNTDKQGHDELLGNHDSPIGEVAATPPPNLVPVEKQDRVLKVAGTLRVPSASHGTRSVPVTLFLDRHLVVFQRWHLLENVTDHDVDQERIEHAAACSACCSVRRAGVVDGQRRYQKIV